MASLDLAGIITRVCTDLKTRFAALSHTHSMTDVVDLQSTLNGKAASSHSHGYITNIGAITSDTAVASGDKLVISDSSDSSRLKRSGIAFGSDTTTFLRNDGTWQEVGGGGGSWTNVTSAWESVNPEASSYLTAMTDGTFVYVSGITDSIGEVNIPNGYEPLNYHVGVAYDPNDLTADAVIAEFGFPVIYRQSGSQNSCGFSITYPIDTI